jgi:hypothetical protein
MQSGPINGISSHSGWGCSLQRILTVVLPSYFLEHYTDLHDRVGLATAGDTIHVEQQLTGIQVCKLLTVMVHSRIKEFPLLRVQRIGVQIHISHNLI